MAICRQLIGPEESAKVPGDYSSGVSLKAY